LAEPAGISVVLLVLESLFGLIQN